uniref:Uncharacterized protein n=1 Tax=Lotharella globosa TaxID=91324 RepID=A0A7S3YF37_9EUKA|mmetsp:Transcript_7003/g.13074  ORF Transcript_7003/g.13074 Transcript_7003/m.13074 type:complete len:161 (+) Transcript_7003:52-534(+)
MKGLEAGFPRSLDSQRQPVWMVLFTAGSLLLASRTWQASRRIYKAFSQPNVEAQDHQRKKKCRKGQMINKCGFPSPFHSFVESISFELIGYPLLMIFDTPLFDIVTPSQGLSDMSGDTATQYAELRRAALFTRLSPAMLGPLAGKATNMPLLPMFIFRRV